METYIIDFETYYDKNYSLSKMPIMQYIRDPRFEVLGLAVKPFGGNPFFLRQEQVAGFFEFLKESDCWLVAHNAAFDLAIAWERYGYFPYFSTDTKHLATYAIATGHLPPKTGLTLAELAVLYGQKKMDTERAVMGKHASDVDHELIGYAVNDVIITEKIYKELKGIMPPDELLIAHLHTLMAVVPMFHLNEELLRTEATFAQDNPLSEILRSNNKFRGFLLALGLNPPDKLGKTSPYMQKLLHHKDPAIRRLAELRLQAKSTITKTRAQRFLDIGSPLPVPLRYYGAHTGRSSGDQKMNMQNLPAGGPIRRALLAPPGHKLVIVDSAQIEPRVLAELANDDRLREACYSGDLYTAFAAKYLYHKPEDQITKEERKKAKPVLLGCMYGQGAEGLKRYAATAFGVEFTDQEAQAGVRAVRLGFPGIVRYWCDLEEAVRRRGRIELPSGRALTYPGLDYDMNGVYYYRPTIFCKTKTPEREYIYGSKLCENATQAVARDVVYWQVCRLFGAGHRPLLLAHDEVVLAAKEDEAEKCLEDALQWFSTAPTWLPTIQTKGTGIISNNYGVKP